MTALPSIASFTGATVTEGDFKTALSNMHLFLSGLLGTTGNAPEAQAALGALLGAGALTKTGAYTVAAADRGKIIACSGTFAITLPDAGAVGNGFAVAVANVSTGTITVDPFSTQTIDGAVDKALIADTMAVCCAVNGEWLTVGGTPTATTARAGIVQLVDSVASTSVVLAPTANACRTAYQAGAVAQAAANAAQSAADGKVSRDAGYGAVGSFCLAKCLTTVASGGTTAGSNLTAVSFNTSGDAYLLKTAATLTGTWRNVGGDVANTTTTGNVSLWQRIS